LDHPEGIAADARGNIYVANSSSDTVTIYSQGANGNVPPAKMISGACTGLHDPNALTLDPKGNVYVGNFTDDSVTVYSAGANGDATPTATISGTATGVNGPEGIAVDASGNIYLSNYMFGGGTATLTVYAVGSNGNTAPVATISGAATGFVNGASGIAIR